MSLIKKNKIEVIYTVGDPKLKNFKIYMENICFSKHEINKILTMNNLTKCS